MSKTPPTVLLVDDDHSILVALERALRLEGYDVRLAENGEQALELAEAEQPAIVILDVTMPGISGVEVTRRLRQRGYELPICMLSARDEVEDRVAGLQAGADDYVVKPFALAELTARMEALLRRTSQPEELILQVADLKVDCARRTVARGGREIELTRREFELLEELARHEGIVLTREQLLLNVWGYDFEVDGNVVDVFIGYLRRKLESDGEERLIHTVRGVGFVMRP